MLNDYRVSLITAAPVVVVFMQKMTTTGAAVIRLYRVGVTWPISTPTLIFPFCSCALAVHEQTTRYYLILRFLCINSITSADKILIY